jgi:hypothetical protein
MSQSYRITIKHSRMLDECPAQTLRASCFISCKHLSQIMHSDEFCARLALDQIELPRGNFLHPAQQCALIWARVRACSKLSSRADTIGTGLHAQALPALGIMQARSSPPTGRIGACFILLRVPSCSEISGCPLGRPSLQGCAKQGESASVGRVSSGRVASGREQGAGRVEGLHLAALVEPVHRAHPTRSPPASPLQTQATEDGCGVGVLTQEYAVNKW